MSNEVHLMIDLETLSLTKKPVLLSAAVATFDKYRVRDEYVWNFHLTHQMINDRVIDEGTLLWWKNQDIPYHVPGIEPCHLIDMATKLEDIYTRQTIARTWCRGLNFDVAILDQLFMDYSVQIPWKYDSVRDLRTVLELAGVNVKAHERTEAEKEHSPIGDVRFQIRMLQLAWREFTTVGHDVVVPE